MGEHNLKNCTAFKGNQRVASGSLLEVVRKVKSIIDQDEHASIFIFDDETSELVEVDFRGTIEDVQKSLVEATAGEQPAKTSSGSDHRLKRGPGRPKLGVVSREVTLLPRHWDWLNSQPGGASVALRKLVEEARRVNSAKDKVRHSQEVAYKFMSAMAGDFPGFEEAIRALFAGDDKKFKKLVASWPVDIQDHARKLAEGSFQNRV